MTRHGRRVRLLAIAMAAQAGFIDALGFLHLGGYYVSFMSGNSTRMAVEGARAGPGAAIAATLVALFVGGVILGAIVRRVARGHPLTVVQGTVAILLLVAACCQAAAAFRPMVALMVIAMGIENAAFEKDGEVSIGLTYVTGALVKMGQLLVAAFDGGSRTAWLWQGLLWSGLVAGAAVGALLYRIEGVAGLWFAAAFAVVLAGVARWIERSGV